MFVSMVALQSALLLRMATSVYGHGHMLDPAPRNWLAHLDNKEFCQHCLNRDGGGGAVSPGDRSYQPGGTFDTGKIAAKYASGQVIEVKVQILENHKGFWKLSVCEKRDFDNACFAEHVLERVSKSEWNEPTGTWSFLGLNDQNSVVTESYKLPAGLTCDHCTMQWMWITGNSCRPPSMDVDYVETYSANLGSCGPNFASPSDTIPEKFWNVADIQIGSGGSKSPSSTGNKSEVDIDPLLETTSELSASGNSMSKEQCQQCLQVCTSAEPMKLRKRSLSRRMR